MKLSEVTRPILENYLANEYENLPYPNLKTWMSLGVDMSEHIQHTGQIDKMDDLCWEWCTDRTKVKMYVIHNSVGEGRTTFSFQIKRFAYYLYNLEAQRHIINEVYQKMISPPKLFLHNRCDNLNCFNPEHLIESYTSFDVNKVYDHMKGEACRQSKLTNDEVRRIHYGHTVLGRTTKDLAEEYYISTATVYCIITGKTWKHLGLEPIPIRTYTHNKLVTHKLRGE